MPRESSKCRQWEKERRNRLNEAISNLSKLLPSYDPAVNVGKIDIIKNAAVYIEDLQGKLKEILLPDKEKKVKGAEILKLQERIKKLLHKNEQLCYLLKQARISIPSGCISFKKIYKNGTYPWSNRITNEQAKVIQKNESEKENSESTSVAKKRTIIKKSTATTTITTTTTTVGSKNKICNKLGTTTTPKHRKAILNRLDNKKTKANKFKKITSKNLNGSKCLIVLSQPSITQSCYVITNAPSNGFISGNNGTASTIITNSDLLTNPLVTSNIKTSKNKSTSKTKNSLLSTLGPGTLILANGAVVPVLPEIPKIVTNSIIPSNNSTIILVPRTLDPQIQQQSQLSTNKNIAIKQKYCLTHTTQVNKVPIPALTSRYANNLLVLNSNNDNIDSNNKIKIIENKKIVLEKKLKNKDNDNKNENKDKELKNVKRKLEEKEDEKDKNCSEDVKKLKTVDTNVTKLEKETLKVSSNKEQIGNSISKIDDDSKEKDKTIKENDNKSTCNTVNEITTEIDNMKNASEIGTTLVTISTTKPIIVPTTTTTTIDLFSEEKSKANQTKIDDDNEKIATKTTTTVTTTTTTTVTTTTTSTITSTTAITSGTELKTLDLNITQSELSNDIFASLQVPTGCQNPESTSPTAAFLLAFPLVSSLTGVKVTEVTEEDNTEESQHGTPTLLQIGTMDTTKPTQSESLTPSLLNLDNLSFFSTKDICNSFYNSFETNLNNIPTTCATTTTATTTTTAVEIESSKSLTSVSNSTSISTINKLNESKNNLATKIDENLVNNNNKHNTLSNNKSKICPNNLTSSSSSHQNSVFEQKRHSINSVNNLNCLQQSNNYQQPKLKQQQSQSQQQQLQQPLKNNYNNLTAQLTSSTHCNSKFNNLSKICTTCCYVTITKSYPDPLYTNSNSYMYSYPTGDTNFNQNYYKNITKNDNRSYYTLNYENYSDYKKNDVVNNFTGNYYNNNSNNYTKDKFISNNNNSSNIIKSTNPTITTQTNTRPINWMTTPDNRLHQTSDYMLPPFTSKDNDFGHNSTIYPTNTQTTSYFNTNSSMYTNSGGSNSDVANNLPTDRKGLDLQLPPPPPPINSYQRNDIIEQDNQFSWSPTKIPQFLDPQHSFVSSTLPTLVGDLALGNHLSTFNDHHQKNDTNKFLIKDNKNRQKMKTNNYDNQNNFFSVSQLVDHNKSSDTLTSSNRVNSRRNSSSGGNRNNTTTKVQSKSSKRKGNENNNKNLNDKNSHHLKQLNSTSTISGGSIYSNNVQISNEIFCENKLTKTKTSSSNYSAEALIGLHMQSSDNNLQNKINKQSNYSNVTTKTLPPVPFLTDNIIPYFPPVDLQQDNNYIVQQNQNYHQTTTFSHNFSTSFQNNSYSSTTNSFIPSTITNSYLNTNNFMNETNTSTNHHDYSHDNLNLFSSSVKDNNNKNCNNKICNRLLVSNRDDKIVQQNLCTSLSTTTTSVSSNTVTTIKKSSSKIRKQSNDNNTTNLPPNFVDFPFLSMPGTINSPILPDDFHVHTGFLQPPAPQLYSCKNPLYPPKQNPDLSSSSLLSLPSVTRNNIQHPDISPINNSVGTSLTNFNLSTIFPEINKGPLTDNNYLEHRNNKDVVNRNFSSSVQIPFNDKPTFSLSYINCPTTQTYNNQ